MRPLALSRCTDSLTDTQKIQIYMPFEGGSGRHKVLGRANGVLRPKLFCEAKMDKIYDPIIIDLIEKN